MISTLAAAAAISAACSWDRPGHNPFTGQVPAAVERYTDIPPLTRAKLRVRMERRAYDDVAVITRDGIKGASRYADLRDMHFGAGQVCGTVSRANWSDSHAERGLVYCEDGHCLIVPTVCRNVSRVTKIPPPAIWKGFGEPMTLVESIPFDGSFADLTLPTITVDVPDRTTPVTPSGSVTFEFVWSAGEVPRPFGSMWGPEPIPFAGTGVVPAAPVPEPDTVAMLCLGLGIVWIAAFRANRNRPRRQIPQA